MPDRPHRAPAFLSIAVPVAALALTLAASSLLGGCAAAGGTPPTPTPWPTEVVVQQATYTVQRGDVIDRFGLQGRASPVNWDPLYYIVDGKLSALNVTEGANVKKGDILAELDTKLLSDQLTQAKLTLEQAQKQAQQQESTGKYALERARINLQLQELALQKMKRSADLPQSAAVAQAQADLDKARVNLQKAQSAYNAVSWRGDIAASAQSAALQQATIDEKLAETKYYQVLSDNDVQVAQQELQVKLARLALQELEDKSQAGAASDVSKAQIQVDALQRQIEDRHLRAPYDGLVVALGINLQGLTRGFSQRPKVGDNIAAYSALVVVAKPQPLEVTADGAQKRVAELYVGQPITLTHQAWTRPFTAMVTALPVAMSGAGNQPSGSLALHVDLPPNAPPMANGDPIDIQIEAERHENTLFLPPAGVRRFAGRAFVVMQDGDKQRRVDVTLGLENSTQVEILGGLREGDIVIAP